MRSNRAIHWWSSPRTLLRQLLMLEDTPHSVALGTAIGMFIGMTPTVGIQMLIVVVVSFLTTPLFRFNRMAALITVYISNPLTMLPIYWANYKVGTLLIAAEHTWEEFSSRLGSDSVMGWWDQFVWLFEDVGMPLLVGSLIVATVLALATYPAMRALLRSIHDDTTEQPASEETPVATGADRG